MSRMRWLMSLVALLAWMGMGVALPASSHWADDVSLSTGAGSLRESVATPPLGQEAPPTTPSMAAEPGIIQGTVTDYRGQPIAGATIAIMQFDLTTICETPVQIGDFPPITLRTPCSSAIAAIADSEGRYRTAVATEPTLEYTVQAFHEVALGGEPFMFELHPVDGDRSQQRAAEGIVEDFRWQISGRRPTVDGSHSETDVMYPADYYGGSIDVVDAFEYDRPLAERYPAGSHIEVTLEPRGPMIDGSQGETVRARVDLTGNVLDGPETYFGYVLDVPVGPYSASAAIVLPNGQTVPLLVSVGCSYPDSLEGFAASDDLDFEIDPLYIPMGFGGIATTSLCVADG